MHDAGSGGAPPHACSWSAYNATAFFLCRGANGTYFLNANGVPAYLLDCGFTHVSRPRPAPPVLWGLGLFSNQAHMS